MTLVPCVPPLPRALGDGCSFPCCGTFLGLLRCCCCGMLPLCSFLRRCTFLGFSRCCTSVSAQPPGRLRGNSHLGKEGRKGGPGGAKRVMEWNQVEVRWLSGKVPGIQVGHKDLREKSDGMETGGVVVREGAVHTSWTP